MRRPEISAPRTVNVTARTLISSLIFTSSGVSARSRPFHMADFRIQPAPPATFVRAALRLYVPWTTLENRNVPDGSTTARGDAGAPTSRRDESSKSARLRSAGGVSDERSKAIVPVIFVPGSIRSTMPAWSSPVTEMSVTFHRGGGADTDGGPDDRVPAPDRATSVYSPGATP